MAIKKRSIERVKSFNGQKSGQPIESYDFDSAEQIQNFYLKEGRLIRSNGSKIYAQSVIDTSGGVTSLHRFKKLNMVQRNANLAVETSEESKVFTTIETSLGTTSKLFSTQWRDRSFLTNSDTSKFFLNRNDSLSGYKFGDLGLSAPPACALPSYLPATPITVINAAPGSLSGPYGALFTFYDEETNTESPGYGAVCSQDGLYDLSPNSQFGPQPAEVSPSSTGITISIDTFYLSFYRAQFFKRATHIILYVGTRVGGSATGLWDTFFRVPYNNPLSSMDGDQFIRIDTIISEGGFSSKVESITDLTTVSLAENNSPPPTKQAVSASFDRALELGATSDAYDASKNSGFRHVKFFRDQLFGIGSKGQGYNVSEIEVGNDSQKVVGIINDFKDILYGSEVGQPDYFPYLWEVGRGDGQEATGLGVLGDQAILAFKERSTYYLAGSSPDNFVMRIMDTNSGCVHQSTIQETPIGVICLDRSGFVLYDKIGQGTKISEDIEDVVDSILFNYASNFYSAYDPANRFYYCAVVIPGSQTPNLTLCLDLKTMQWSTQTGAEGRSRVIDTTTSDANVDIVGSAVNGNLYDLSDITKVTYNGDTIDSVWTSGALDFGDDQHKKRMRWLYLRVRSNGNFTISVEVIPDFNENNKFVISEFNYEASQSTWFSANSSTDGTLFWDEGNWEGAGLPRKIVKIPIVSKGYSFQVRIINRDTDEARYGFELEGISAEAVMLDK